MWNRYIKQNYNIRAAVIGGIFIFLVAILTWQFESVQPDSQVTMTSSRTLVSLTFTPPPPQPTFTIQPTFTSPPLQPTYTLLPTYTPLPTHTLQPTQTPYTPSNCFAWEFHNDGDSEGWQVGQDITIGVLGGNLFGDLTQPFGYWIGPSNLAIDATTYSSLEIKYRVDSTETSDVAYFYWIKADDPNYGNNKRVKFDILSDNMWHETRINLASNVNWNNIITGMKLYPAWFSGTGASVEYDYIRLCY